ncbi:hypothetical protein BGZ73_001301 [Actinomortierella ambigua]|nr:hypothetical protein BGZ73_001301 [Actinomortierella ambigua]
MSARHSFDDLCRAVFLPSAASANAKAWAFSSPADLANAPTSETENALSLLLQAQPYELPRSALSLSSPPAGEEEPGAPASNAAVTPATAATAAATSTSVMHRRLPLESVGGPVMEQRMLSILRQAGVVLVEQPYDRNMGGSYAIPKSRSELLQLSSTTAPLERPVVLAIDDEHTSASMWLIPESNWVEYTARVRFWRQESHRVKAVQRQATLVDAIQNRWTIHRQVSVPLDQSHHSYSRPSSASSSGTISNTSSAPGSPLTKNTATLAAGTEADSALVSPTPTVMQASAQLGTTYQCYVANKDSLPATPLYQPQQGQEQALLTFVHQYGDELSAWSLIRGLLDFIRKQIGDPQLLTWTLDSANLTEQKFEITEALLDLLVRLGMERVDTVSNVAVVSSSSTTTTTTTTVTAAINSSSSSGKTTVDSSREGASTDRHVGVGGEETNGSAGKGAVTTMDDIVWTIGLDTDDRQLAHWVETLHQNKDPARSLSSAIRDRYLHDRHTIAAGSVEPLVCPMPTTVGQDLFTQQPIPQPFVSSKPVRRRPELVLARSRWSKSTAASGQGAGRGGAVGRARKDLADLARWATSCCSGRLDWLWRWFHAWLRPSSRRRGGSSAVGGEGAARGATSSGHHGGRRNSHAPGEAVGKPQYTSVRKPSNGVEGSDDDDDRCEPEIDSAVAHRVRSNDENV